jgi:UDP-N-acetylglucosamine--N-acetylmuramyl-(pentapeptide) pyrophosphoryl-undecaprenol N-acetylglucosamine transferase
MRVVLAGGGTGGHVIPAIAIAQELHNRYAAEALFIGTARGLENRLVPAAGFPLQLVKVGALNRVSLAARLKTIVDLPRAIFSAGKMLDEFETDVVIGVGGYASGPAMAAAIRKRIPTLAFEPNLVPGFANRIVARFVSAAAVHFEQTAEYFRNAVVTGVPVRPAFFSIPQKQYIQSSPTLLVFGGSQGARAINQAMTRALPELTKRVPGLRVIHQTGEREYNEVQSAYAKAGISAEVHKFIDDMPAFFARADLVLCRSGASTVAEIAAAGKPAIFVPFPLAADDHQRRNAEAMEQQQAAVVLEETTLDEVWLVDTVCALLDDPARLVRMSVAGRAMSHPNATRKIAELAARVSGIETPPRIDTDSHGSSTQEANP